jgi:hypothetical protein
MDQTLNAVAPRNARDPLPIEGRRGACADLSIT